MRSSAWLRRKAGTSKSSIEPDCKDDAGVLTVRQTAGTDITCRLGALPLTRLAKIPLLRENLTVPMPPQPAGTICGTFCSSGISMAFSPSYNGVDRIVLTGKASSYDGCKVIVCSNETDLLNTFFLFLKGYDPDIIAGYNSNQFDIPYIDKRCKMLNINPNVTRDNRNWYIRDRFDGGVDVTITGRVVVDLLPLIRKGYSLPQYTLREAAKLVNYEKLDVSPQDMRKAYIGEGDWDQVIHYSDRDAELVIKLILDLKNSKTSF